MNYFQAYKDIWDFHKKSSNVQTSNEYWQQVIDAADQLTEKYNKHPFMIDLTLSIISELEREAKKVKENKQT